MDEDILALCAVLALFISFPVAVALITTGCIAYSRAKAWDKQRNLQVTKIETSQLITSKSDDESDFSDSDDENERKTREAEEADSHLTFKQKWAKEFRKVWNGKGAQEMMKAKEREERRKLAKAVAREMDRRERRKARQMARNDSLAGEKLSVYRKD